MRSPRRAAAALLGAWIAALLLLQTLGVLHAIVHPAAVAAPDLPLRRLPAGAATADTATGGRAALPTAATVMARAAPAAAGAPARPAGWADALFAGHDKGGGACALYDQLVQPALPVDAACSAGPSFAPPAPTEPTRSGRIAPQAAGFLARGPPVDIA